MVILKISPAFRYFQSDKNDLQLRLSRLVRSKMVFLFWARQKRLPGELVDIGSFQGGFLFFGGHDWQGVWGKGEKGDGGGGGNRDICIHGMQ